MHIANSFKIMPPEALLTIKKGERPFKCMNTEWAVDSDGQIMFRFLSKLRADKQVDLVLFSQRQDNRKFVMGNLTCSQDEFLHVFNTIRQGIWNLFPGIKVECEDFAEMNSNQYSTYKLGAFGMIQLHLKWILGAIKNKLRWFFTNKPPM